MNTSKLKQFAQNARRQLIKLISTKLSIVLDAGSAARRENEKAVKDLEKEIARTSHDQVIEKVAYIWFNRFCALQFMDANRYTTMGVVSPAKGFSQPEILMEAKQGHIDAGLKIDKDKVFGLLNETIPSPEPQQEAYRMLLVAVCNDYNSIMPFLFEKIADFTELLMPDDLLSDSSILTATREALSEEVCADVEVIGWLYQFYISEKKDEVFAGLKKNKKVTPENIPAATQLFTPNWIVRYLVENSLGRLWMLNNPNSKLIDKMDYYIKPEQEETDFLVIQSPEEIKICDPACGSGHMLVYAFEILYFIYEEQGYDAPQIPQLILEKNLYGIEIDERAGELAAFALFMKAREKYRRFFKKDMKPNICVLENVAFKVHEVESYMDAVNPDLFTMGLSTLLYQFEEADNFGSLIRPELTNVSDVLRLLDEKKVSDNMFLQGVHQRVLKVLKQADYLSPKYHVVVANPPYMGGKGMNPRLGEWATDNFPNSKSDLFAMFMERNLDMAIKQGIVAMITMQSWMFLSSFENFRKELIGYQSFVTLIQIGYNSFPELNSKVAQACAFVFENHLNQSKGAYLNLNDAPQSADKERIFIDKKQKDEIFRVSQVAFHSIPGSPIAYWVSPAIIKIFDKSDCLDDQITMRKGLATGENSRFLRKWFEVSISKVGFDFSSRENAKENKKKWFPINKGGSFRKWYGNHDDIINWENDGYEIRNFYNDEGRLRSRPQNIGLSFKQAITWSKITSGQFSARYCKNGFLFDDAGAIGHSEDLNLLKEILPILTSKIGNKFLEMINCTLNFQIGDVARVPILRTESKRNELLDCVTACIKNSTMDWDSYETSWNFSCNPMRQKNNNPLELKDVYQHVREQWRDMILEMEKMEEDNNKILIETYGLQDELTPEVPLSEITLICNPHYRYGNNKTDDEREVLLLADTMKEFISYAVGCMLGRYSLDKPGLILANQGESIETYLARIPEPTFKPDDDNVIPIMDVDWFTDDIAERFKKFLKLTFGEEHYTENLAFIEKAIGKDIRKFFLKDFYTYHVKMYKKRPIYWMFSSPKGSFNALIYMHRYRPDTVSIILNDYLREFRTKLTARKDNLEHISISASASQGEKAKALKEIENIKKVLDEVNEYEREILYPLAVKKVEIDLDDGVKINYPLFGKALKKIPGLS